MFANINAQDANGVVPGATITGMAKDLWGTTGGRIKWARMRAGMTQAALGHAVGVKNVYISQLENNVHDASRTRMKMIAAATGVSLGFLELETEDPAPPQVDEPEPPVYFSPQADEAAQLGAASPRPASGANQASPPLSSARGHTPGCPALRPAAGCLQRGAGSGSRSSAPTLPSAP